MAGKTVDDADGQTFHYRLVNSRLERRKNSSATWCVVTGEDFLRMTPRELRFVADVLEVRGGR